MLLVSTNTIRTTNQMSEKKCWFLFTLLNRYIALLRKTSKVRLPVVNLDKASVCGDRKTSLSFWQKQKIGIHIYREFRSVGRDSYLGPNIGRSRRNRV